MVTTLEKVDLVMQYWKMNKMNEIINKYDERLKQYGYSPKSLGWMKGKQTLRFKILTEIGNMNDCSVLDVGCGFGDLYKFLLDNGLKVDYLGLDINPNLINLAKKIYPSANFIIKDVVNLDTKKKFDWIILSGIFEFKMSEEHMQNIFNKLFSVCNKGIAVNFLSSYVDFKSKDAFHVSPESIFSLCKTLSRRVLLRHDYMPFEFTIYLYKDDQFDESNVFGAFKDI